MDDSMNSVHNISAMDISPASSPISAINPISSNHLLLNAFQQQQELLSNILLNEPNMNDYRPINKNPISYEHDHNNSKSCGLFSTVLSDNSDEIKTQNISDESNQLRQRIITESIPSIVDSIPTIKKSQSSSSQRSSMKIFLFIPILILITYLIVQHLNTSIVLPRSTNWQNASEYLTKNLIGQDQGLEQFKDAMNKHKNFTIVIIEGPIGTGKSYLASSLEKFLPTTLISTNTLLGLSSHHWIESHRLSSYLLSYLSPSLFQFLIIDDLDLLPANETYCQTLTKALYSINNNKNVFIILLQTGPMSNICKENLENIITKSIQFNMLQRDHIRTCIQNEAYIQNVQPSFDNQQIENILNSLQYINEQGILYSTTGCKQIPSLVMLESKKYRVDN
ncbi:unnamed protein product [Rotaria sordida]|uniref:ATPase AAA-type core domain-containing protein n=2 Tax=Rotaria sordida TaxID=392033 RepID=A0A813YSU7_9BILA|nr:unnamed protein product [Rotaria sordida]CAF1338711.1 unnamed protein product [Rotaria sordida]CAF3667199.1 unnamed protein product [Rotaria sordida]CAF3668260.1 unnamed protein product [Rotaria sordida]